MKVFQRLIFFFLISIPFRMQGQTLPVGTPVLEDYYRRAQLLGKIDPNISFTVRPVFLSAIRVDNDFNYTKSLLSDSLKSLHQPVRVKLLPVTWLQQYNSLFPSGFNDGAMIPARGYQTLISLGFYSKLGPLSIQFRPEYVHAQNRDFQQFYKEQGDYEWYQYSELFNFIDLPERFGDKPYSRWLWGQSSIRLTFNPISIGVSNENLWWGPGIRNSLLMTNSAAGFKHITLNTVRPIKTRIGSFEGQLIAGRLENSGIYPPDTVRSFMGHRLYIPKRDEWRYLNGVVLSYHPKWVPGLFLGLTKSLSYYGKDVGSRLRDILPVLYTMNKAESHTEEQFTILKDQRSSVFIRWLMPKENAEIYWEFGREDRPYDSRDLMLQLEYTRAYILGLKKLFPLKGNTDQCIQVNVEFTQLEQTNTNPEHLWRYWYSNRNVRQGYTNEGQLIGAGIGPGSNLQSASISWNKALKSFGLQLERYVHNNDLHNIAVKDIRGNWVDLCVAALGEYDYKNFLFSFKFECIKSMNYEDLYIPAYDNPNLFWIPGKDLYNFHIQLGTTYRF